MRSTFCSRATSAILLLLSSACGGAASHPATPAPTTFAEQVDLGARRYGEACASCHGASGQGVDAPRLVGLADGALPIEPRAGSHRSSRFVTVADVASFAVASMPPSAPGSLPETDYWAILAFDLHANGIELHQPLDASLAATLTIPR
jgi:cytochrome c